MIYFDNAATTRALPSVAEKMTMMLCEQYGNPASVSAMGLAVEKEIRNAADIIARGIRAKNEEIFFTSGGTEGDNWAIYGTAEGYKRNGQHFITTQIEHPAVKNPMKKLEENGCEVTWLAVDRKGHISLEELADAGAKTIIRVGTCGGVQPWMKPGTIVIASGCVRGEGASYELVPPEFPAVADPFVVAALTQAAHEMGEDPLVGLYRSHDAFYMESKAAHPGLRERMQKWIDTGVLVVENESGTLFTYSHLLGLRAGCVCVALGSMFSDPNAPQTSVYGAYSDPDFLAKRIEVASRIAIRAAEILEEVAK